MTRVFCFDDVAISSMHEVNCQLPLMGVEPWTLWRFVYTGWQEARRHNRPNHMVTSHSHFRDEEKDPQTASPPLTQRGEGTRRAREDAFPPNGDPRGRGPFIRRARRRASGLLPRVIGVYCTWSVGANQIWDLGLIFGLGMNALAK